VTFEEVPLSSVPFTGHLYLGSLELVNLSDDCRRVPNQSLERADHLVFDSGRGRRGRLQTGQFHASRVTVDIQGASKTADRI
jgi:hypothetical protein